MIQTIMIVGYVLFSSLVSLYFMKRAKEDTSSFYTASRSMPMIIVAALLFSEIIAGSGTIGNAQNAFNGGLSNAIWANWGMAIGCFLVVPTVSKFYRSMAAKHNAMTIPQCYAAMFGEKVRIVMIFVVALVYLIFFSTQASAASTILAPLLGIDSTVCTWAITFVFIIIAVFGGMVGVSWMGVLHTAVMIAGMSIVAFFSVRHIGGLDALRSDLPASYFSIIGAKPMNTLASALGTAISFLASSNVTAALFGSKDKKSANGGMIIAGLLTLPFALMPAIIGICAKVYLPDISSGSALYAMANSVGQIFGGLVSMAIIAAIWSTAPSLLMVISGTFTKDLYCAVINPHASEKQQLRFSYVVIVIAGIAGTWLGMGASSILNQMLGAFQIRSVVGVVLLAALAWPRVNSRAAFWSMMGGGIVAAGWFFAGNPFGIAPLWPATAVCLIILIPITLSSKEKISDGYRRYMEAQEALPENKAKAQA